MLSTCIKTKKINIQIFRVKYLLLFGNNGKLPHLFIPGKNATLIPDFAVEDLPLDITANLVPAFVVKDLPLGRRLMMIDF